jgi:thioredoxin reductase (NADPH)
MNWFDPQTAHWTLLSAASGMAGISYVLRRARGAGAARRLLDAQDEELVPVSLHPQIDPLRCIGSGACVRACPEGKVLQIVDGVARLVNPLGCVGHGACALACSMDAIRLVFGTETRGVELPRLDESFQTSAPGVYVVGELAGMGLIRNAVRQGVLAGAAIARRAPLAGDVLDAVVVGAGPAGISAGLALQFARKRLLVLERETFGGTIAHYPRAKVVMSGELELPGYGRIKRTRMSKEELLALWQDIRSKTQLPVETDTMVSGLSRDPSGAWRVESSRGIVLAGSVVLALGRRGAPRKLEIPGEELPKVAYGLIEPEEHAGRHVLVVGGGNSAIESALALADFGGCASVSISYRREHFARARGDNLSRIGAAIARGAVRALLGTELTSIAADHICLRRGDGDAETLANDAVIIQIGGTDPSSLLRTFGVELHTKYGDV